MALQFYFTFCGSYDGAIKISGRWIRAVELNRIDKTGWRRYVGAPSIAIARACRDQPAIQAVDLFPELIKFPKNQDESQETNDDNSRSEGPS